MAASKRAAPPVLPAAAALDPEEAARLAHLRYVSDSKPGIRRIRKGDGWEYRDDDGTRDHRRGDARAHQVSSRFRPPRPTCGSAALSHGHLQAVGRDARGRKQYRYHARWRVVRDEAKYGKMLVFGRVLPKIREQVEQGSRAARLCRARKVLAAIVRLLETHARPRRQRGIRASRTRASA